MYQVTIDYDGFDIFPESKKTGKTFKLSLSRTYFRLRHESNDVVTFKWFNHQGKWKWNDSRSKGCVSESHVVSEVARMLFQKDEEQAKNFLMGGIQRR